MSTRRRALLQFAALGAGGLLSMTLAAHTPYSQWKAYRQKHLTIGCHREDPATYELAKAVVSQLEVELPEASARVARGPTARRLASLLGTDQMHVAVLSATDAVAMAAGIGAFAPYGHLPLRQILRFEDDYVLTAIADMPEHHVEMISGALLESAMVLDISSPPPQGLKRHAAILALVGN